MSGVNQRGEPIQETTFGTWNAHELTHDELAKVVAMLLERMKLTLKRTNATKYGATELVLDDD